MACPHRHVGHVNGAWAVLRRARGCTMGPLLRCVVVLRRRRGHRGISPLVGRRLVQGGGGARVDAPGRDAVAAEGEPLPLHFAHRVGGGVVVPPLKRLHAEAGHAVLPVVRGDLGHAGQAPAPAAVTVVHNVAHIDAAIVVLAEGGGDVAVAAALGHRRRRRRHEELLAELGEPPPL